MLDYYEELRRQARDDNYIIDAQGELRRQARDCNYGIDGEGQLGQWAAGAAASSACLAQLLDGTTLQPLRPAPLTCAWPRM